VAVSVYDGNDPGGVDAEGDKLMRGRDWEIAAKTRARFGGSGDEAVPFSGSLNGDLEAALAGRPCDCVQTLHIYDHGKKGEGGTAYPELGNAPLAPESIAAACGKMCIGSTLYFHGCWTALSPATMKQIAGACNNIRFVTGCTGKTHFSPWPGGLGVVRCLGSEPTYPMWPGDYSGI
jgi:hypothetical protein